MNEGEFDNELDGEYLEILVKSQRTTSKDNPSSLPLSHPTDILKTQKIPLGNNPILRQPLQLVRLETRSIVLRANRGRRYNRLIRRHTQLCP